MWRCGAVNSSPKVPSKNIYKRSLYLIVDKSFSKETGVLLSKVKIGQKANQAFCQFSRLC